MHRLQPEPKSCKTIPSTCSHPGCCGDLTTAADLLCLLVHLKKNPFTSHSVAISHFVSPKFTQFMKGIKSTESMCIQYINTELAFPTNPTFPSSSSPSCILPQWLLAYMKSYCISSYSVASHNSHHEAATSKLWINIYWMMVVTQDADGQFHLVLPGSWSWNLSLPCAVHVTKAVLLQV